MKLSFCLIAIAALLHGATALARGDAQRGAARYAAQCGACHSLDANRTGPAHRSVFGRRAGTAPGFNYSPALQKSTITWNAATLERWLKNPEALIPGQAMGYAVTDPKDRADIIAFLKNPGSGSN